MMQIEGSAALVTGAGRGMGREFVDQLLERGVRRVYATSRTAPGDDRTGVVPLALDVTDPAQAFEVAEIARDVSLVINNAGITTHTNLVAGDVDAVRRELDTHFWGTLNVVRAFAPILAANGGGAVLNMLSALSWRTYDGAGAYAAGKAAAWSLTDSVRLELAAQGTQVSGLFVGAVDTDMMAGFDIPKLSPAAVVRSALDGIEAGDLEILADDTAAEAWASLRLHPRERYPQLGEHASAAG